jgi:hypothetical protein
MSNDVPTQSTSQGETCSNIDSIAISGSKAEAAGVTIFANEACESVGALASHYEPSKISPIKENIGNLTEYFSRPVPVVNFETSTTQGSLFSFPGNMSFILSLFPNGINRLTGVYGMRFTTVFTLTAAATPFHQGVLSMGANYLPPNTVTQAAWRRDNKVYACTNIPHVRLDLSSSTMAQLRLPYASIVEFSNVYGNVDWFQMSVVQILPTPLPASLTNAECQLYMHLEDIELYGAVPQTLSTVIPQVGRGMMAQEQEEASYPFSSTVRSAAKTMSLASRAIPLLGSLLSTPIWFANAAANSLRSFGYSKPIIHDPVMRIVRGSTVAEHNVDLPTPSLMLAPTSDNKLAVDGQLGLNNVDEMALEYVLSQWSQVFYGTISTTQVAGQTIYLNTTSPCAQWYKNTLGTPASANVPSNYQLPLTATATTNAFMPSTLMAVSQIFRLWRGGIQFRITFAKTKFHGGRVMLNFNPTNLASFTAPTFGGQANPTGQSMVFDLRDSNVVEFECPFVDIVPNLSVFSASGLFTMVLVNQLIATPSVSSTVDFLVEVRASPGFDLSAPAGFQWPSVTRGATIGPIVGATLSTPVSLSAVAASEKSDTMIPQSGMSARAPTTVLETIPHETIKYTVGESIKSLKQLIAMPKLTNSGAVPANGGDYVNIPPWYYTNLAPVRPVPSGNTFPSESFGTPGNIAQWYAFVNGSTECHFYTPGRPTNTCMIQWVGQLGSSTAATNDFRQTPASNVPRILAVDDQPLHFVIPPYQRTKRIYPSYVSTFNWIPKFADVNRAPIVGPGIYGPNIVARLRAFNNDATATLPAWISRCAGDDARCALYMGPVPMILPGATVTGPYDPDSILLD